MRAIRSRQGPVFWATRREERERSSRILAFATGAAGRTGSGRGSGGGDEPQGSGTGLKASCPGSAAGILNTPMPSITLSRVVCCPHLPSCPVPALTAS